MANDIYIQLRERLDQYSTGFRTTGTGVELKILEKLFTEKEARMYLVLSLKMETAPEIALRIGLDEAETETILKSMNEKGLVFPKYPKTDGEPFRYAAAPWAHGIIEHQLKRLDREMAELYEDFLLQGWSSRGPAALRNIPVNTAIESTRAIAPYDDVKTVIKSKERIALADCICRRWQEFLDRPFDEPVEVCMLFDYYGEYYVDKGLGRWISQKEALEVLRESEKAGLVPQLSNSENPEALCNCHSDCCGQLRLMKLIPVPGLLAASNYTAAHNREACTDCEICIGRCPMDALALEDDTVILKTERCIGCGLCVSVCPDEALALIDKPESMRMVPPERGEFMIPSSDLENDE
jgi:electron transport complex protein RnfB